MNQMLFYEHVVKFKDLRSLERPNVAIVIPTYNQYEITKKFIKDCHGQTADFDIIVVDNASSDGTIDKLQEEFGENLVLIQLDGNYGGAGGFCIGQKFAFEEGYEYIILNDNDAWPISNYLVQNLIHHATPTCCSHPYNIAEDLNKGNNLIWFIQWICMHRDTVDNVGFVSPKYFILGDEVEYKHRLLINGISMKKVTGFYTHPDKYNTAANRMYFRLRNNLDIEDRYKWFINRDTLAFALILGFYKEHLPLHHEFAMQGIEAYVNQDFDNSVIRQKRDDDPEKRSQVITFFRNHVKDKKVLYTLRRRIVDALHPGNKKNCKPYSLLKTPFYGILITHSPATMNLFTTHIFLFNDIDGSKVSYFYFRNGILTKLKAPFLVGYYLLYLISAKIRKRLRGKKSGRI